MTHSEGILRLWVLVLNQLPDDLPVLYFVRTEHMLLKIAGTLGFIYTIFIEATYSLYRLFSRQ